MKGSTLEKDKLEIIQWVAQLKDQTAIERLKMLKNQPNDLDWWYSISIDEKAAIEAGLSDVASNKLKSHVEVMKEYEKYL